jgi:hypothetical protein
MEKATLSDARFNKESQTVQHRGGDIEKGAKAKGRLSIFTPRKAPPEVG